MIRIIAIAALAAMTALPAYAQTRRDPIGAAPRQAEPVGGRKVDRALVPQLVSYLSGPSRREGMADYSGVRADLATAVIVC